MKIRISRVIAIVAALAVVIIAIHTVLALHPRPLFRYRTSIEGISVYSNRPEPQGFSDILLQAKELTEHSAMNVDGSKIRVILSRDHFYNRLFGKKEIAYATHYNAILAGSIDLQDNSLFWNRSGVRMNLTTTLAHEIVHCLQGQHHGLFSFNLTNRQPLWKKEGYAEYISQRAMREASDYSLFKEIDRLTNASFDESLPGWIRQSDGCDRPLMYYRSRLLTEYLLDVEGLSYTAFVLDEVEESDVFARMMKWHRKATEQLLRPTWTSRSGELDIQQK